VIIRIFRLFRIFRLAKIAKYSEQLPVLIKSIGKSAGGFFLGIFSITMFLILWASAIYYVEISYCTFDTETNLWLYDDGTATAYQSIPHSLWWTIVTMCTVGYGDTYPLTAGGKTIGVLVMLCGIIVLAFPLTILSGNFMGEWVDYLQVKEKRELKKLEKQLKKANNSKGKELYLLPPPLTVLKDIWKELISLKFGIDSC